MHKTAIYCRVSTDTQELGQQVESCKKFCEYKGLTYDVFTDIGSGKNMDRKGFQDMLQKARIKDYDSIVVFRFDRLGRNAREVS